MDVKTGRRIRRPAGRRDFKKDNESFIKRERDGREVASLSDRGELCEPRIQLLQKKVSSSVKLSLVTASVSV